MAQIILYGIIGKATDRLDAVTVTAAIRAASGDLSVLINSPGGLVFEGLAIYAELMRYDRGKVIVQIDGLAASMGSVIAMAGTEIIMAESALMMIHKPWDASIGNADDLRSDAARLDRLEEQLIGIYARRTGLDTAELGRMLAFETWMSADEALALGFVTATSQPLKIAAIADVSTFGFVNVPDKLKGSTAMPEMNAAEVTEVRALCAAHRIPAAVANQIFVEKMDMPLARAHMLSHLASQSDALQIGLTHGPLAGANENTLDNPVFHATAVEDAIYCRLSGKAPQGATRELMDASLVDLAREMIERRGVRNATRMRPNDVLEHASWSTGRSASRRSPWLAPTSQSAITHTTGDFPALLQGAGQRWLIDSYQSAESALKTVARKRTANDFRTLTGVQLSGFGALNAVNEAGEVKYGTFSERKESYAVGTYAKLFSISRNALINDDLGAFGDSLRLMGRASAESEALILAGLLNSNPVMGDGNALFSTAHGNLAAVSAVPSVAALDAMRLGMRTAKDLDGVTILNVTSKYLVVPATLETAASVLSSASWTPNTQANANPFSTLLQPVVEPRLASATAWYGFADPAVAPVLEYAYLDGNEGPQTETKEGWSVLGTEFRVVLDFGAGITGYAGAYKNAGA